MGFKQMGFKQEYFPPERLEPLRACCTRRVRFEEIDPLGIVWHGRYPSYFEDGRTAFGDRYGLSYKNFRENGVAAPVVQMHIDYRTPLRFDETITIEASLHWSEALKLNFSYRILKQDGALAASGYTVQLLTDFQGGLLLTPPEFIQEFRDKWQDGSLFHE